MKKPSGKKPRELSPMERMADLTRRVVAVPKSEVDKKRKKRKRH